MIDIFNDLLDFKGLNTLLFYNPYAKLYTTSLLSSYFKKVVYIDLDTTFTAFQKINLNLNINLNKSNIILYTINGDKLNSSLNPISNSIISNIIKKISSSKLVILDSINSLYNLSYNIDINNIATFKEIVNTQHIISNFLMFLLSYCKSFSIPLLITCMIKYNQMINNIETWIRKPVNYRFFEKKSKTIFYTDLTPKFFLEIISHDILSKQTLILNNSI